MADEVVGEMVSVLRGEGVPPSWDVEGFRRSGYSGFVSFAAVASSHVPTCAGTYVALRPTSLPPTPTFVSPPFTPPVGLPLAAVEELRARWEALCAVGMPPSVLYIGKTDARRGLHQRLNQYRRAGAGGGSHHGGRDVWRLADADALLVAWRPLSDAQRQRGLTAERHEDELLVAYMLDHDGLTPWANPRKPSLAAREAAGLA